MKKIFLVALLVSTQMLVVAGNNNNKKKAKSNQKIKIGKEHKMDYQGFVEKYGTDDTSVAVIEIFFDKRENAAKGQMSFLPLSGTIALVYPPLGVGLVAVSTPLFVNGLLVNQKYNRRKLKNILEDYHQNNELPVKLKDKVEDFIDEEQEYQRYYEDRLVELYKVRVQNTNKTEADIEAQAHN
ncbi:MAG TPA: hypothetical protein VKZ45_02135 [Vicingaceae bacterium]|nr:hypothetical protein [Vicingaceae bacterium]